MSPPPEPRLPSSPVSRALLTARGCAACAADRTGTGARRGARRSLRSVLPPAPFVLPQSLRGVEGAERPAPSQAPAGGAPGHSARGSGRPLLEPPRDRPEVRTRPLKQATSRFLASFSGPVAHMLCHLGEINEFHDYPARPNCPENRISLPFVTHLRTA